MMYHGVLQERSEIKNKLDDQIEESRDLKVKIKVSEKNQVLIQKDLDDLKQDKERIVFDDQVEVSRDLKLKFKNLEKNQVLLLLMLMAFLIIPAQVAAKGWTVGGNHGWTTNLNYTHWAENKTFFRNDWLMFVYDSNKLNVLEVNKDDYQRCREVDPIRSWKKGAGRKLVGLNITKTCYFISGNSYCYEGVKLSVSVQDPAPSNSAGQLKWCLSTPVVLLLSFLLS
ncbi:hypothetical protein C5167_000173 [Papaver somniferum]|uniref:Phytocyanin domain-containing protein n=1 Tax=Papaver somniferum TaxID=3469 RepID=A0A4Y7KRU5_PAPSO|nr:lamin-like protein [Papaver somniferum]RZC76063.1 hypothetical protein C5167_000173 [Papaver somniferum]